MKEYRDVVDFKNLRVIGAESSELLVKRRVRVTFEQLLHRANRMRARLAPVVITPVLPAAAAPSDRVAAGSMEIVLCNGRCIIVGASVDAEALARVVKVVGRR